MNNKNVIIVGAGRLGKGFLGETFYNANWNISFLDKDPRVISELKKTGSYDVSVHTTDSVFTNTISGYKAFLADSNYSIADSFLNSNLIMLPLYPADFKEAAEYLGHCFDLQYEKDKNNKKTLICLTNKNHIINEITEYFRNSLKNDSVREWFDKNVVVRDSIVRRSTDAATNYSTKLVTTAVASLLIQGPVNCDFSDVKWLDVRENVEMLKDIKVFLINGPHATTAYAGYLKGYDDIAKAEQDPDVQKLIQSVHDSAVQAVLYEYPVTRNEIRELEYLPAAKDEMSDSIFRVGFDPIRKLGKNDRLLGVVKLCQKYNIKYDGLIKAAACGFAYTEPKDKNAMIIQNEIKNRGITATVAKYIDRKDNDDVVKQISQEYNKIQAGKFFNE
ncbi:mannitol dehydrogenase [Lactobacillus sp. ESL0791]|uniref:mannitol dehydrogenase family protein n=1 Tax=Lactobacillus sp. ESL0791 TaxID=2983234 RepID=UPI0023F98438|nr:mannitol dehydrogenase [Lactobacillus sp. ESL0791]MDF7639558.1 mannitol dehydrogenase [Lactobacillus sp. ESL0791]